MFVFKVLMMESLLRTISMTFWVSFLLTMTLIMLSKALLLDRSMKKIDSQ